MTTFSKFVKFSNYWCYLLFKRDMLSLRIMETDQERFDCFSIEVHDMFKWLLIN